MNYEEKYKEALERAKNFKSPFCQHAAEVIFPELRESEDERIRKELIERFNWELKGAEEQDAAGCSRQKDIAMFKRGITWLEKQDEQKPAWSEEDENVINHLLAICAGAKRYRQFTGCLQDDITKYQNWLKSLKDRFQLQPKQEWSEEDEERLQDVIYWFEIFCAKNQTKPEMKESLDWLKSLKPQNKWKPSEEQMKAIKYFIDFHRPQANASTEGWSEFKHLESLYNNLKNFES